jgi:hypothetical protein
MKMSLCFVSTRRGSHFMTELLTALARAAEQAGHDVQFVFDRFPAGRECVYVVVPHEFRAWGDPGGFPDADQRAQTIALCTENPGTPWFEHTYELVPQFAAAISINRSSAAELQKRGIRCEHLQLGYAPEWDTWHGSESSRRDIDVLYLGAADPRRDPLLGEIGCELWAHNCQFLIPPLEPRIRPRADFLVGADKYRRLRSTKVLLNLHRTTSAALEWMRFLEAICNGCVVVSEPCLDSDPLVAGEHFLESPVEQIASAAQRLLDDPDRLVLMRRRAYDFVRMQLPMAHAGTALAELAAELPKRPPADRGEAGPRQVIRERDKAHSEAPDTPQPTVSATPPSRPTASPNLRGGALSAERVTRHLRPWIFNAMSWRGRHDLMVVGQSGSFATARPRVSVLCTTAINGHRLQTNNDQNLVKALASIAASCCVSLEVLIVTSSANEWSPSSISDCLVRHPSLALQILRTDVDGDSACARNGLVARARGQYLFNIDTAARVYPSTLQRLAAALDADPQALFAYPMVAIYEGDQPVQLASSLPWEPERLVSGNWIDGIVFIRRSRLLELGGYSTDPRLAAWEDFELWCRCAQAGGHGVHVPQVLARRRRTASSAAADGEDGKPAKWKLMRERFPQLFAPSGDG